MESYIDIESLLEKIRLNCVVMNKHHKKRYIYLKGILRYFRIPIIILSGLNSVMSVGLQPYVEQGLISASTCIVSLLCGIIGSVELYLSIQQQMETELMTSKEYYLLGIDIYKVLSLTVENRNMDIKVMRYWQTLRHLDIDNADILCIMLTLLVGGRRWKWEGNKKNV